MEIKKVTEYEMSIILENKIEGVFYYINNIGRCYCYVISEKKVISNIWRTEYYALKWMDSVIKAIFK